MVKRLLKTKIKDVIRLTILAAHTEADSFDVLAATQAQDELDRWIDLYIPGERIHGKGK